MVIVVVSVHAYNIGIVKYDHKILFVVVKILGKEIKQMFVQNSERNCSGANEEDGSNKVREIYKFLTFHNSC